MDLGIAGKKGIVGGASSGLGKACAMALAREGVELVIVARTEENIKSCRGNRFCYRDKGDLRRC